MTAAAKKIAETETEPTYLDDRDLAARTSLSRATWQTLRSRGKGPPYYKVGKRCLYRWAEVEAWLEGQRVEAKAS